MSFWDALYNGLVEFFWFCIRHLMGYGASLLGDVLEAFGSFLPSSVAPYLVLVSGYIDVVNAWIPIDAGVGLYVLYLTGKFSALTVRHIIKMIPTIG